MLGVTRCGKELRQFPEVMGGGSEKESVFRGPVGGVRDQAFGMQIESGLDPILHGLGRCDLVR